MTKKMMITGGAGFIGHHVVSYFLKNTDYDIVCLDRLDFSDGLNGKGFQFNNPNASRTCGCGESFAV